MPCLIRIFSTGRDFGLLSGKDWLGLYERRTDRISINFMREGPKPAAAPWWSKLGTQKWAGNICSKRLKEITKNRPSKILTTQLTSKSITSYYTGEAGISHRSQYPKGSSCNPRLTWGKWNMNGNQLSSSFILARSILNPKKSDFWFDPRGFMGMAKFPCHFRLKRISWKGFCAMIKSFHSWVISCVFFFEKLKKIPYIFKISIWFSAPIWVEESLE